MTDPLQDRLRAEVAGLMPRALDELRALVALRSVADAQVEDPRELELAARWVRDALAAEGLEARFARTPDGTDAVIATYDGPPDSPRVLLYAHYDVQPAHAEEWTSDPWDLTERDGRHYGRGAADCKGNILAHLTALRACRALSGDGYPCSLTVVVEGSEEQGTGGLEDCVRDHPEEFAAEVVIIGDVGNIAVGVPTLTVALRGMADTIVRVRTGSGQLHSGAFGGAAPDALAALIAMLASLRDADGNTTIDGLAADGVWEGTQYDEETFRADAGILPGVRRIGSGTISDHLWARPAVTVLGIDAPAVIGSVPSVQPAAAARVSLRVPPGQDPGQAQEALVEHLRGAAPWGVHVEFERVGLGRPFAARQDTRAFELLAGAMADAFDAPTQTSGQGGSIPLTAALADAHPEASIVLVGVAEPASRMHAEDESVHPDEISHLALAEALFLHRLAAHAD
ncbi:M20/M25/M40 family metallo-hydrolase [Pseudactinotalea sp. HY160]|uniref:M20/M25/M40 family metallo-hydrolase n=1 Tax=Pseudactinotalea sp. HY160 TaxID=2654490 RepID=UPI00128D0D36|nr:M20/M25/M40 family metallo-hydrolase [Pseudactinotalea sp. HY160]MPV51200.1 M20/M25/M40 family metallo-hydrolase [Pseudactinotalea sp. HY160]